MFKVSQEPEVKIYYMYYGSHLNVKIDKIYFAWMKQM